MTKSDFEKAWERAIQKTQTLPLAHVKVIKEPDRQILDDHFDKLGGHLLLAVKPIKDCVEKLVDDGVLPESDLQVRVDGDVLRIIVVVSVAALLEKSFDLKDGDTESKDV